MRLLLANPNTSVAITERIAAVARAAVSPGTTIVAVTAAAGVPYIASRAEAVIGARAVLELFAEHAGDADAAVIAAFADPGLGAARELLSIPVVGMAEAAMLTACMLGRRFAIVTFTPALEAWYQEAVDQNGLAGRCSGIHCLAEPFADVVGVARETAARLVALCAEAVAAGADVCILGGAPLAGLAAEIAPNVAVPLVDGVAAAARQAETLAALRPRKATAGSFRRPAAKAMIGVPAPLVRLFGGSPA
ncbi:MAG: aspartate/glutamate racemase family protein [Acetobacteraceae bacterium]